MGRWISQEEMFANIQVLRIRIPKFFISFKEPPLSVFPWPSSSLPHPIGKKRLGGGWVAAKWRNNNADSIWRLFLSQGESEALQISAQLREDSGAAY